MRVQTEVTASQKILIVEDDTALSNRLALFMNERGFAAKTALDGRVALATLDREPFDLILLDLGLPGLEGLEVLRSIRAQGAMPVIVVTSKQGEGDVVLALEVGADDYVVKPFRSQELLARVRAVLRRAAVSAPLDKGEIVIDVARRRVCCRGQDVELSSVEIDLLAALMQEPGVVLDREGLLRRAGRGAAHLGARTVDVHISRLRRKLEIDPKHPQLIKTVHGRGYIFIPPGD
ncbi:MAG: response regulator transcription factor [Myxococcota bacterium]